MGEQGRIQGGIVFETSDASQLEHHIQDFHALLSQYALSAISLEYVPYSSTCLFSAGFSLQPVVANEWLPGYDAMGLSRRMHIDPAVNEDDLLREILVTMLAGPLPFVFPSFEELNASIRIRLHIVAGATKTMLAFKTSEAERPEDYWTYHEDTGFTIKPGVSLIDALTKATQPDDPAHPYSFSCYRATEYVTLLGLAIELARVNPDKYAEIEAYWQKRAIMSGRFHDVFLIEHGSMANPMPLTYFVPGDRTWFRNPDNVSSDACGYEGSWVMYLGSGLFTNFWNPGAPYTLTAKCIELYHWRHGTFHDAEGNLRIDENIVQQCMRQTMRSPQETTRVMNLMMRHRDPSGVYAEGGCMDTTREYVRHVCPANCDISLPIL